MQKYWGQIVLYVIIMVQFVNKPKTRGSFLSSKPQSPISDGTQETEKIAASLMNRVISRTETFGAFRVSLNLLRNFSAPAASPSSDPIKPKGRKKKKKKKNLIEVAQFLPN